MTRGRHKTRVWDFENLIIGISSLFDFEILVSVFAHRADIFPEVLIVTILFGYHKHRTRDQVSHPVRQQNQ